MLRPLVVLFALGNSATAQSLPPPEVVHRNITASGKLIGCSLEFTLAFRDRLYKRGEVAGATGSVNLWRRNERFYSSFKFVASDIRGPVAERFKVHVATLFDKTDKANPSTVIQCEDERAYCAAMSSAAFLGVIEQIVTKGGIRMAFNRKPEGMDVPVELAVQPSVADEMLSCAQSLGEQ